ncbi:MAG: hypothetical protein AAFW46_01725 [Pseudomonadota bacterium]
MISGHDLEAFDYYEKLEAHRAVAMSAVEKSVKLQSETMHAGVVAFELAMEWAFAPLRAASAMADAQRGDDREGGTQSRRMR